MEEVYKHITIKNNINKTVLQSCLCLLILFFCQPLLYGQKKSEAYLKLYNKDSLTTARQQRQIDSLFERYNAQQQFSLLANDLRYYAGDFINKDINKAIQYGILGDEVCKKLVPYDLNLHKTILFNLGISYNRNNERVKAIRAYQKLISLPKEEELDAEAYSRIGFNYMKLGDLFNAISYHEKAAPLLLEKEMFKELFTDRINASDAYRKIDDPNLNAQAIRSLLHAETLNDSLKKKKNHRDRSYAIYLSIAHLLHGEKNLAYLGDDFEYYNKALAEALKQGDSAKIARTYNDMGVLLKEEKNFTGASDLFVKASVYGIEEPYFLAFTRLNQSDIALHNEDIEAAQKFTTRAIAAILLPQKLDLKPEEAQISDYETIYAKDNLFQVLKKRAASWMLAYEKEAKTIYLENAFHLWKLADQLLDIIRFQSISEQSKLYWQEEASSLYIEAVKTCYLLNNIDQAFYFMEKNKAILLLEDLAYERSKNGAQLPDALIARENRLKDNMLYEEEQLIEASLDTKDSLKSVFFREKLRYEAFIDSLKVDFPKYYYLKKPAQIIAYEDVKKKGNVLEYILPNGTSKKKGYGLFSNEKMEVLFELPEIADLNKSIHQYRQLLTQPFQSKQDKIRFINTSLALYNTLIPREIRAQILGSSLTIIPDGNLQNIPFEALITEESLETYFLESCEIHYVYSLSFLEESESSPRNAQQLYAGFAPGNFGYDKLAPLKNTETEVLNIQELVSGHTFLKEAASTANFIKASGDYKILHLATHANTNDTISPWIAFKDKKMSTYDLYSLRTQAELVVLSACNTAQGKLQTGEGVMSLARAFFQSGTASVLSSLWNVNDQSGDVLMSAFYENLKSGDSKSKALQKAKISYIKTHDFGAASPYYWASYILIGNADQVIIPSKFPWIITLSIGLIMLLLFMFFRKTRKQV